MRSLWSRPWLRRATIFLAGALCALAVVAIVVVLHKPGNVSHPDLSFTAPKNTPPGPPKSAKAQAKAEATFVWPVYGYTEDRARFFNAPASLKPPFHVGWKFNDHALLEFPPVMADGAMYVVDDNGYARRIETRNGHVDWRVRLGTLSAASPGLDVKDNIAVMVLLSTTGGSAKPSVGNGRVVGVSMRTGHTLWSRRIPSGTESSPLVTGGAVYFGDQAGTVYSLNVKNGHVNWTFQAAGAVKGGLARTGSTLYFGDYAGRAYAIHDTNGHKIWAVSTDGSSFGFGSGTFYSTPAVAFGRVYLGNTDGFVYSFAAGTGQLAWRHQTGAYVYASPAVADIKGLGPTVYIGSYDGRFYALNAQSGAVRWSHPAGGRVSGAATVVGDYVYYSDLGTTSTTGLDARTGRVVWTFGDGAFNPIVADYDALYESGYGDIYQLLPYVPKATPASKPKAKPKPKSTPKPPPRRTPAHRATKPKTSKHRSAKSHSTRRHSTTHTKRPTRGQTVKKRKNH